MKKIIVCVLAVVSLNSLCDTVKMRDASWTSALSAGYVFKHGDGVFKEVYGVGMVDAITADICYHPWRSWGIGAMARYWFAKGHTSFLHRPTKLHEVPLVAYVRAMMDFSRGLRLYASLGGGAVYVKETSYLGHVHEWRGIGQAEVGLFYPLWRRLHFTSAFAYLFPRQSHDCTRIDVGGFDLRVGLAVPF